MPLGYALVARVAEDHGIRCLAIKGPVLEAQGLRAGHVSNDVDVLVDPARHDDLCTALESVGWGTRIVGTSPSIGEHHSRTLAHPAWPCEIDVHRHFPGFLASPAEVFEVLWEGRTTVRLAGADVPCPEVAGSAAIAALHVLRDPRRRAAELPGLVDRIRAALDDEARADLATLAEKTHSVASLEPLLQSVVEARATPPPVVEVRAQPSPVVEVRAKRASKPPKYDAEPSPVVEERAQPSPVVEVRAKPSPVVEVRAKRASKPPPSNPALHEWQLKTAAAGHHSVGWVYALKVNPVRRWPGILRRAVLLTEPEIRLWYPDAAPGWRGLWWGRAKRLAVGLRSLPEALRIVRRPRPPGG